MRIASASSVNGITAATGPKISSRAARSVAENRERGGRRGLLDVRIGEDDVGRLAAELESDALDRVGRERADAPPNLGRPGERDLRDVWVLNQAFANRSAGADHDVQHSFGDSGLEGKPLQLDRGQRREGS